MGTQLEGAAEEDIDKVVGHMVLVLVVGVLVVGSLVGSDHGVGSSCRGCMGCTQQASVAEGSLGQGGVGRVPASQHHQSLVDLENKSFKI